MRLSRCFIDAPSSLGEHELPEAQAHYIGRVLRIAEGDALQVFDGSGHEFTGRLLEVGKIRVRLFLDVSSAWQIESPLAIHLGLGLSRGHRMDWAIQKATELGVNDIPPIMIDRCAAWLTDDP
ncbi:RsmE family RNA methyltransferase, partial [Pseudomonas paraversuta]|uniref:RsmE family RNA methyltransferase n=1 Tax=Pseudomonas paraversuta TaxID=2750624 RepID=UPI001932373A